MTNVPVRHVYPTLRMALLAAAGILLGACGTLREGYPNHTLAPSLAGPSEPATDNRTMYLGLIRQMQGQGDYYASLAHIDAFRLRYGNPPELQRMQADALRETGQDAAASRVYTGLLHGTQAAPAWHGLGLIAAAAGDYALAEQRLRQAVALAPIDVTYLSDLGYARLAAGDIDGAHEPLAEAVELAPDNVKAISNLALWASLRGDDTQAAAIMQRAKLPPATCAAIRKLAAQMRAHAMAKAVASSAPTRPNGGVPPAVPTRGIPAGVLDRFGNATAISETQP